MSFGSIFNRNTNSKAGSPVRPVQAGPSTTTKGSRVRKSAAVGAALVALVGAWEGLRTTAYKDIVGVPTVCYGETKGVKMGDKYTVAECKEMLKKSLDEHSLRMEACLKSPQTVPDEVYIAAASLTYNIGSGAFCKSSMARYINSKEYKKACDSLKLYNKAGGRVVQGLVNRRADEYKICIKGV